MAAVREALGGGELRVYHAFTAGLSDPARRERGLRLLSEDERARHARFRFEADQHSYLLAHALVRSVLAEVAGVAPLALQFELGEHGRPELRTPALRPRVRFNLSHTRGAVACAVALEHDVGVDVEQIDRRVDIERLSEAVFSERERAALLALPTAARRLRFFQLWTLKESYIKAVGMGLSLPLRAISFEVAGHERPRIGLDPPITDDADRWWFDVRELGHATMLAVAFAGQAERVRFLEREPLA